MAPHTRVTLFLVFSRTLCPVLGKSQVSGERRFLNQHLGLVWARGREGFALSEDASRKGYSTKKSKDTCSCRTTRPKSIRKNFVGDAGRRRPVLTARLPSVRSRSLRAERPASGQQCGAWCSLVCVPVRQGKPASWGEAGCSSLHHTDVHGRCALTQTPSTALCPRGNLNDRLPLGSGVYGNLLCLRFAHLDC